jgi:RNA polymerase sigma-70 factor (ECF subfamily)
MQFVKSITFDDDQLTKAVAAVSVPSFDQAEAEFIDRLRQRDADAFDTLVQRYSNEIYSLLTRMTEDAEEAADLTQETFLSAVRSIVSFRGDSGLRTWLFRIAVNNARNRFRWWNRRQRSRSVSLDTTADPDDVPLSERVAADAADPETVAINRERETAAFRELRELPAIYREVIVLCDIEGLSYEEISSLLEINIGTVKSRLARGRDVLRRRLKDF